MNNKVGLKQMFEQKEALTLLARSIDSSMPSVTMEAVKLMAAVCLVPPDGHERALEAITISGEIKACERFTPIIQGLKIKGNDSLRVGFRVLKV